MKKKNYNFERLIILILAAEPTVINTFLFPRKKAEIKSSLFQNIVRNKIIEFYFFRGKFLKRNQFGCREPWHSSVQLNSIVKQVLQVENGDLILL